MRGYIYVISFSAMVSGGCKTHYSPPAVIADHNYLVVEGTIVSGGDSTIIHLSRTVNISNQLTSNPEMNAVVTVEGDQGASYSLPETDSGKYASAALNLDNLHKYRLKIATKNGETYTSDYEQVITTPPMDTLGYDITGNGFNVYASTHDPSNNTRYYRWDYTETYIYISPLHSTYKYVQNLYSDTLESVPRTRDEFIDTCYVTINSNAITLNSTAALSKAIVNKATITQVPEDSEKILHRYSIIVREYGLTLDAFNFWQNLSRNTDKIGTVFDALPSEITTNLHCTSNPALPVVGYIGVSTVSRKRIFIDRTELPVWPYPAPSECKVYFYCWTGANPAPLEFTSGAVVPFGPIKPGDCHMLPGWDVQVADYTCADCRYHLGGKTKKPAFWQ
ncbi:MAG TPA: DUF4249 domain-containing protein [Mucilaginibacter sp.]|nr:DUF4249 domain-containing protein [Mucilaginibacter sp.]